MEPNTMFKDDLLAGKRILVTGGGTGLGRSMTERYLELGAEVVICGRRGGVLEEAAAEMHEKTGGKISTHVIDIRNPAAVDEMVEEIWRDGPLTGLVNNAAGNFLSRTEDLSHRGFDAIANIVFHGTFYVTHACGRHWLNDDLPGDVISIIVTWVWTGSPYVVPSAMSKAGVAAMTRSLAVEWGPNNIRLNAIAPGPFPTEGAGERLQPLEKLKLSEDSIPLRRMGDHSELANLAVFLMADGCGYITGEVIAIDGGRWLDNSGSYSRLVGQLDDQDWQDIREAIQQTNEADRKKRG